MTVTHLWYVIEWYSFIDRKLKITNLHALRCNFLGTMTIFLLHQQDMLPMYDKMVIACMVQFLIAEFQLNNTGRCWDNICLRYFEYISSRISRKIEVSKFFQKLAGCLSFPAKSQTVQYYILCRPWTDSLEHSCRIFGDGNVFTKSFTKSSSHLFDILFSNGLGIISVVALYTDSLSSFDIKVCKTFTEFRFWRLIFFNGWC